MLGVRVHLAALGTSLGERVRGDETSESPVIWDNHCHLSGVEGKTPSERMANLLKFADRLGIARVVVYMGWPFQTDPYRRGITSAKRSGAGGDQRLRRTGVGLCLCQSQPCRHEPAGDAALYRKRADGGDQTVGGAAVLMMRRWMPLSNWPQNSMPSCFNILGSKPRAICRANRRRRI